MPTPALIALSILVSGAFLITTAVYRLHIRPLRQYRLRRAAQKWFREEQARLAAIRDDQLARRRRMREMSRYAPQVTKRLTRAFAQLDVLHFYRTGDDPRRESPRQRVQPVTFDWCLVDTDALYLHVKLPWGIPPSRILDKTFQEDLRLEAGFPDLEFIPTDREGLWLRVPARGSTGGIPDFFLWHTAQTRRNALDMLEDKKLPHLAIGVGMASGGRLSIINLQKESDGPSILVAGASGRGKSNTLNGIICTLIRRNSPAMLQFYMVDLKHVELSAYESLPHLARPVALEEGEAIGVFDDVMKHMAERQAMFAGRGVRKIATWNEKYPAEALPYLVVIIDELAMLMASRTKLPDGRGVRNEAEYALGKLTAVGRAYGVHCILCTQRPSTDVIIGTIKANVPTRIALGVASPTDSMTIINNGMAAGLDPVGRCILYSGGRYTECQAPLIYDEQIRRSVAFANKYALPKQTATNERLWELIGSGEWGGLPDLYERGVKDTFSLTYSEFVQWYWRWAYSLPDCAPVITLGKEKYILHLTKLLPIGDKPPTSREQLERLEVTR